VSGEQPLSAEKNPPGDIPDTQAFVAYRSPAGFQIDAPEGWSQTSQTAGVTFVNNFNGERVTIGRKGSDAAAQVLRSSHAVRDVRRNLQTLPAGPALHLSFTSNSEANAVTGKQVRLTNEVDVFGRASAGRASATATLWLWAPAGSDNADQWARIVRSFRWR
jgi:hypothetical protein